MKPLGASVFSDVTSSSIASDHRLFLRLQLAQFRARRPNRAAALVTLDWTLYATLSAAVVYVPAAAKPAVSLMLAFVIGRLFVLGHDACHGSLFGSRRTNAVVGRLLLLASWTAFTPWELAHNGLHHGFTNLKGRDDVWAPMSFDEYGRAPWWRQWLERVYRTAPGLGL